MERTQTLNLDFTSSTPVEFYCDTFAGDMHSCTVELTVTPTPKNGELLLCSFLKNNVVVDTVVVRHNQLTIPYSVLKAPGDYTAAFAVADMESRLTAPLLLTVRVAEDRVALAPTEDMDDQSLVCYILEQAASTARAATEGVLEETNLRIDQLSDSVDDRFAEATAADTQLSGRITEANTALATTRSEVVAAFDQVTAKFAQVDQVNSQQADRISDLYNANANTEGLVTKTRNQLTGDIADIESRKLNSRQGQGVLTASTSASCANSEIRWVRIGSMVIVCFGFYTTGETEFVVSGLPYTARTDGYGASLLRIGFTSGSFTYSPSHITDQCQTVGGTKSFIVRRQNDSEAVVYATLIYFTDDE